MIIRFSQVLVVLGVGLCCAFGLKTPSAHHKHHESALDNNGKQQDILQWNGLDYEYGMFDHSQEKKHHVRSNDTGKNVTKTGSVVPGSKDTFVLHPSGSISHWNESEEQHDESYEYSEEGWYDWNYSMEHEDHHDKITIGGVSKVEVTSPTPSTAAAVEVTTTKNVVAPVSKEPEVKVSPGSGDGKSSKDEHDDENDSWSWDYEYSDEEETENKTEIDGNKQVSNVPSDNDLDVDKYFNPDRYRDQQKRKQIEDQITHIWTVQYENSHQPCIMLRGDIKLVVPVNPTWFNRDSVEIDVPAEAEASGTCQSLNNDYQEIVLKWNVTMAGGKKMYPNSVYFAFATNWTSEFDEMRIDENSYGLVAVTVVYYNGEIGGGDEGIVSYSVNNLAEYVTPLNESISCFKHNQVMIVGGMQLTLENMQIEAFRPDVETLTPGEFSRSVLCSSDEAYVFDVVMTYIIWFWIGALLVVLTIFVVLLSLGYRRRRCQESNGGFGYKVLEA